MSPASVAQTYLRWPRPLIPVQVRVWIILGIARVSPIAKPLRRVEAPAGRIDAERVCHAERPGGTIGKTFLVETVPVTAVFASYLIRLQPKRCMDARFTKLFMESPQYWDQLRDGARGAGQPNVNSKTLSAMAFHLPSLAEQWRIVAKADELMALCEQLEASLASAETDRARLLEALLHEALDPAA